MTIDFVAIQKILTDAVKEHDITANVPTEALVGLITADMYRKLSTKASPAPKPPARRNQPSQSGSLEA